MGIQLVCEDEPDRTVPENTFVRAKLVDIVEETVNYTNRSGEPDSFTKFTWWFEITEPDKVYDGRKVKGQTKTKLSVHPRNQLRLWAEALLNREVPVGLGLDTDELLDLPCKLIVSHEVDRKDSSRIYERVDEVIPVGDNFALASEPPF